VETATRGLQEYFCDDLKLSELLGLLSDFFKRVDQARAENEARRQKEQRLARQKEEQLKRSNCKCCVSSMENIIIGTFHKLYYNELYINFHLLTKYLRAVMFLVVSG